MQPNSWDAEHWTAEQRAALASQLDRLDAETLRAIIRCALSMANPANAGPALQGGIVGAVARVQDQARRR
jgi:hypothetical protein